jgi:hypothetical protein
MEIVHRPGKEHRNVDALSRLPTSNTSESAGPKSVQIHFT